jgi:alpha-aminoadipic semialdehyde synthase
MPDNPCYTYLARQDVFQDGVERQGVSVMAIDNLPCEFPRESSEYFSSVLKDFVDELIEADYDRPLDELVLSPPLKRALILLNGEFTDDYQYMQEFLAGRSK